MRNVSERIRKRFNGSSLWYIKSLIRFWFSSAPHCLFGKCSDPIGESAGKEESKTPDKAQPSDLNKNSKEKISASLWEDPPTELLALRQIEMPVEFNLPPLRQPSFAASPAWQSAPHTAFRGALCWFVGTANLAFVMSLHLAFPSHPRI